ncbi:MAG: hypothetical protein DSY80_06425 [Desulfocapsa sp.]|nr:MAG: hypothetical protein DSY80_06425 [Desulfocapsa sp.]
MKVELFSFGFKHGYPEADMVWDVRFLPNPYWIPELRNHTGLEEPVIIYVLENTTGRRFLDQCTPFLLFFLRSHERAGRHEIRLAVGCTGGRHRSVAIIGQLQKILADTEFDLNVFHRDITKD